MRYNGPSMPRLLTFVLLLACAPARAQFAAQAGEEGIGVQDGRGAFYSVTNRFGRGASYFQVTKVSFGGAVLWNVPYNPPADVTASVAAVDFDGNLVIAGTIKGKGRREFLVVKFLAGGSFFWKAVYEADADPVVTALAVDPGGFIYAAATVPEKGGSFVRMVRYGPSGAPYWGQPYRAGKTNYARLILIDPAGDARVTVETRYNDYLNTQAQIRQVLFTTNGGVVQQ